MATLYDLTDQYRQLFYELSGAETDEEANSILAQIEAVSASMEDKFDAYARATRNLRADAEAYKAEKFRLAEKQAAAERAVERLLNLVAAAMEATGATEVKTSIGRWYFQRNPPKAVVTELADLPERWKIQQPDKIDLAGIIRYVKDTGEVVPGVSIVQDTGLRFR